MKPILVFASATALAAILLSSGCNSSTSPDLSALQGTWSGTPKGQTSPCKLVISGQNLHIEGLEGGTWYDATLSLEPGSTPKKLSARVTKSSVDKHVGKVAGFLYRLENGTLTLAVLPPGQSSYPQSFEDPAARVFSLKKQGT